MDILPILAGLFAAVCWGLEFFIVSGPAKEIGQYRTAMYTLLFSGAAMVPFLLYFGIGPGVDAYLVAAVALAGIVSFLGFYFSFRAFRYGDVCITAPIASASPVVVVLASVFILHDALTPIEVASIAAVILGIVLVSTKAKDISMRRIIVAAGVGSALLAFFFVDLSDVFAGAYITLLGFAFFCVLLRFSSIGSGYVIGRATRQDMRAPPRRLVAPIAAAGFLETAGLMVLMYGVFVWTSAMPIMSSLSSFMGGVTAVLGFVILKERPERNQVLGIALAVIGVVVLTYFA
jgi:drug/metabolite transporter (DMT)-like permease